MNLYVASLFSMIIIISTPHIKKITAIIKKWIEKGNHRLGLNIVMTNLTRSGSVCQVTTIVVAVCQLVYYGKIRLI